MASYRNSELAPAKVNLALQIIGRLEDGYHELDSLVAFVRHGDVLEAEVTEREDFSLRIEGEFASTIPAGESNLVIKAAELLRVHSGITGGARLILQKNVPVGAGLGGGSADAAATLRLLNRLWGLDFDLDYLAEIGLELGSDVPSCVLSVTTRMQGIGDLLSPLAEFPAGVPCVLAYPGTPLLTGDVYQQLSPEDYSGELPAFPAIEGNFDYWKMWLEYTGNDLQATAQELNASVAPLLECLSKQEGSIFSRMSGSGSACFALFNDVTDAARAKEAVLKAFPNGWALQTEIAGQNVR